MKAPLKDFIKHKGHARRKVKNERSVRHLENNKMAVVSPYQSLITLHLLKNLSLQTSDNNNQYINNIINIMYTQ